MATLPTYEKKLWAFVPKFREMWPKKVGNWPKTKSKVGREIERKQPKLGQKHLILAVFAPTNTVL